MKIEIHGLELHGTHGVNSAERRDGQTFLFDVTLEVPEPAEDVIEATVDYRAVRDCVREVSDARAFHLLGNARRGSRRRDRRALCGRVRGRPGAQARRRVGGVDRRYRFAAAPVVTLSV